MLVRTEGTNGTKYIPGDCLMDGFNVREGNPHRKLKMGISVQNPLTKSAIPAKAGRQFPGKC